MGPRAEGSLVIRASIPLLASPEAGIGLPQETISRLLFDGLNDLKLRGQKAVEGLWRIELHPVPAPGGDVLGIAPLALVPLDRLCHAAILDDRRLEPPAIGVRLAGVADRRRLQRLGPGGGGGTRTG